MVLKKGPGRTTDLKISYSPIEQRKDQVQEDCSEWPAGRN